MATQIITVVDTRPLFQLPAIYPVISPSIHDATQIHGNIVPPRYRNPPALAMAVLAALTAGGLRR